MTSYALKLKPGGIIPPAINIGIRMRKTPAAAPVVVAAAETPVPEPTPETLPAGTDRWYDVFARSCIPYKEYDAVMCADTPNADLTEDDDFEEEAFYLLDGSFAGTGETSAWWVLHVPPDVANAWLTLDTWLTTGGELAAFPNDTNILVLTPTDPQCHWPLQQKRAGGDPLDFSGLTEVASSDDDPDPADPANIYTSKVTNVELEGGKTYFIRVATWDETNRGQIYRLRLSLTETEPA